MVLVTGATGKLGRLVVAKLLERIPASQVVAGARNPDRAREIAPRDVEVRKVDYSQPATLEGALRGVERVLLISGTEPGRVEQHGAVIRAAKAAGARLVAYTSGTRAESSRIRLMADHKATERMLMESGVPFTVLRNCWYIENYTDNVGPLLPLGFMPGAAGQGRVSAAARADFAEAAAVVLTVPGHEGCVYELGGDRSLTLAEIAAEIERASGRRFAYRDLSEADYAAALQRAGLPEGYARLLADSDSGLKRGELLVETGDLKRLLGRPTTTPAAAIERALAR
jgi:NAD(P)H dehydrogenase (quinone)